MTLNDRQQSTRSHVEYLEVVVEYPRVVIEYPEHVIEHPEAVPTSSVEL
jgi:hypothetical protein